VSEFQDDNPTYFVRRIDWCNPFVQQTADFTWGFEGYFGTAYGPDRATNKEICEFRER